MTVVVTGVSGWALVLLLPVTISLPFVLRRICQNSGYTLRNPCDSFQARGQRILNLDGHAALLATLMLLCGAVF